MIAELMLVLICVAIVLMMARAYEEAVGEDPYPIVDDAGEWPEPPETW